MSSSMGSRPPHGGPSNLPSLNTNVPGNQGAPASTATSHSAASQPHQQQQPQQQQQQQQDFYLQPSASSYYPSGISQGPLPTGTSTTTTASTDSQSSSLLAKRLGTSRAANMALPVPQATTGSSSQNKWLRQGQQDQQQQPSTPQMPPPPQQPAELPATPVWKPRLTPTRRGDDLYLIAR